MAPDCQASASSRGADWFMVAWGFRTGRALGSGWRGWGYRSRSVCHSSWSPSSRRETLPRISLLALQQHAATDNAGARGQHAHNGMAGGGLATTRLPYQAQRLPRFQAEAHPVHRLHYTGATEAGVVDFQMLHL